MWKLKQFIPKETSGLEGRSIDIGRIKVQVRNVVAEGGFSCVYLARDALQPSKQYALKHMICNHQESLDMVLKEISVMKVLKGHPNIVTLTASDIFDMGRTKEAFLLMEFCETSLVSVLESRGRDHYDEKQIFLIFRDVCNAVFSLHCQSPPIAHRDLKAENLLLGSDGAWKLCDFGSTSTNHKCFDKPEEMGVEEDNIRKHTTPAYRSPEMWDLYRREVINEKVDIWALGCILFRICYFKSAFDGESKLQVMNGNYRIPELPKYSSSITDLIKDMLQDSPNARPDITQVWFRVNLQLPIELHKATPDSSPSTTMAAVNIQNEGSTKKTHVIPGRSPPPPPPPSTREQAHNISPRQCPNEEQRSRTSVGSSKQSGDGGPLGMFWATQHAPDEGPVFDEEPSIILSTSKNSQQNHTKIASPHSREYHTRQPPKKTERGNSLNKSVVGSFEDFEIRFDSDGGTGRTRTSHFENPKIKLPLSKINTPTFQNEAFNAFVADFDSTKLSAGNINDSKSRKGLEAEAERLKQQLKQTNLEKAEITLKYEKLSSICRNQQQEIEELKKQALNATTKHSPSNNYSLKIETSTGKLSSSTQQREKIEGSVLELEQGMFAYGSPSLSPNQNQWKPFADRPKTQPISNTIGGHQGSKLTNGEVASGSWGLGKDNFTAVSMNSGKQYSGISRATATATSTQGSSEIKKVETTNPAGWAGF